jgi:hypothetical protein
MLEIRGIRLEVAEVSTKLAELRNTAKLSEQERRGIHRAPEERATIVANKSSERASNDIEASVGRLNAAVDHNTIWNAYYRKMRRRMVLRNYAPLLAQLNLPPAKLGALKDLLTERAVCDRFARDRIVQEGYKANSAEVHKEMLRSSEAIEKSIRGLVGAQTTDTLLKWAGAVSYYNGIVADDATMLEDAGFKLSADDRIKLALIQYESNSAHSTERKESAGMPNRVDTEAKLTSTEEALFDREAKVLSPMEISILRDWAVETHRARVVYDTLRLNAGLPLRK